MDFAKRLAEVMAAKKISQYKLQKLTGVSQSTISDILAGNKSPTYDTIQRLLKGMNMTEVEFFTDETVYAKITNDLLERILKRIPEMNLPPHLAANAERFKQMSDEEKKKRLSALIKSVTATEHEIKYEILGSNELFEKYRSLPVEHQKALALIIASLSRAQDQ